MVARAACGARSAHRHRPDPGGFEQAARRDAQVEVVTAPAPIPCGRRRLAGAGTERLDDLGSHLVAATGDGRADGGLEVGGSGAERRVEVRHRGLEHAGRRPAPARVHRAHDAAPAVGEQDRHAVRRDHTDQEPRRPTRQRVGRGRRAGRDRAHHARAVHLTREGERQAHADAGEDRFPFRGGALGGVEKAVPQPGHGVPGRVRQHGPPGSAARASLSCAAWDAGARRDSACSTCWSPSRCSRSSSIWCGSTGAPRRPHRPPPLTARRAPAAPRCSAAARRACAACTRARRRCGGCPC